jgi:transposase, IS5 family
MTPKKTEKEMNQGDLYRSRLENILNRRHPLFQLADQIEWTVFELEFGALYDEKMGRPGVPTRVMVGLHYLKHMYDESDESVVEKFIENPYWQYFCGFEFFRHDLPIDPSSMTRWRQRIGPERMKKLLQETLETAKRRGDLTRHHVYRVNVDTTVQEKAIAHPTDSRLYQKARAKLVKEAVKRGIELRQSYERLGRVALCKQSRYAHARQFRRARRETRRLRTYLGRVIRDIDRKCAQPDVNFKMLLEIAKAIHEQKRDDHGKVYSVHALEVECISKGKAHKKYEFGCKVPVVSTSRGNWVLDIDAAHGSPYDGHTLKDSLAAAEANAGYKIGQAFCDKGYQGAVKDVPDVEVYLSGSRRLPRSLKRWLRRRSAIEPVIGHLKADNGMARNHLAGYDGDQMNAILSGCGFNLRKLFRAMALFVRNLWLRFLLESALFDGQLLPIPASESVR